MMDDIKNRFAYLQKFLLFLLQGADGIAVGMSTHIFPHNFVELLRSRNCHFRRKDFYNSPDFPTGGIMDASQYDKGKGKLNCALKLKLEILKQL